MRKILIFLLFSILFLFFPETVRADLNSISCPNRFVTLVNPVRGRNLWSDKSIKPLIDQYLTSAKYGMPVTWLLQYDALTDRELITTIKEFEVKGEKGLFLEVSKELAEASGVEFRDEVKWSSPGSVFLSAYSQSERRRIIDKLYNEYKSVFGYYPKSVGAWWIDSYSLKYIKDRYGLNAVLIVADQKTTDSYGVWGQWWGYPYIPSIKNVLTPTRGHGLGAVVIQWAQRDPVLAYGGGAVYSNFSLQANDYIRSGKNTDYFGNLVTTYLDCKNKVGQITIGMETGMEAVGFHKEYVNQLKLLNGNKQLQFVTMSGFSREYFKTYKNSPAGATIGDFKMSTSGRLNDSLGDKIEYNQNLAFKDYFTADKSDFLDRELPVKDVKDKGGPNIILYVVAAVAALFSAAKKKFKIWLANAFFLVACLGLVFRSGQYYGWEVYYGPVLQNLYFIQILIFLAVFLLIWLIIKRFKSMGLFLALLPLSFGIDGILSIIRFTKLSGQSFFGILTGSSQIAGITYGSQNVQLIYKFIPQESLKHFYSFPFWKIFNNANVYLFVYPLAHIVMAAILYFAMRKMNVKLRSILILVLAAFYFIFISIVMNMDPATVLPITN